MPSAFSQMQSESIPFVVEVHGSSIGYTAPGGTEITISAICGAISETEHRDASGKKRLRTRQVIVPVSSVADVQVGSKFNIDGVIWDGSEIATRDSHATTIEVRRWERLEMSHENMRRKT